MLPVLVLVLVATGCTNKPEAAANQFRTLIERDLRSGDPEEKIVAFIERTKWRCSFDRFGWGYQCIFRGAASTSLIGIESVPTAYLHLNEDRSFRGATVRVLNTWF